MTARPGPPAPRRGALALVAVALGLAALAGGGACRREPAAAAEAPATPTLRLYVLSSLAGALEPCGCTKDMRGGVDHAAALLEAGAAAAPRSLVVGAGPLFFMNPVLEEERRTQDLWKAEALAAVLGRMHLAAFAPGANDWAAGAPRLRELAGASGAVALAANLRGPGAPGASTRVVAVGDRRVGLAGVSEPRSPLGVPEGVEVEPPAAAFAAAVADLRAQKVDVVVGLVAAPRGAALRLAEQVPGVDVLVVGKPFDRGEGNDAAIPPVLVEGTLVVEAPNHLQAIGIVDLFLRGAGPLADGTGVERLERRQSLQGRIGELERRLAAWREAGVQGPDVSAREADLARLRAELAGQEAPPPTPAGSHFRYELVEIREGLGASAHVTAELDGYYRRVNDHNREALRDRRPRPVAAGEARYVGVDTCAGCHAAAYEFWKQTPHAGAYAVLERQHKQFNLDCVSCHVTGYDRPGGSTVTHVDGLTSVQCEVCHGAGSLHEDDPESKAGIVARPPPGLCASTCHHPPHVPDGWDEATARQKILGPGHGAKAAP